MTVYHYTSLYHLQMILNDGVIKLTASNLLVPINPHIENGSFVDVTDDYKPVVWASSVLDFSDVGNGLDGGMLDKTEVAIAIDNDDDFIPWDKWSEDHKMDKKWKHTLTKGRNYKTWYVSEKEILISDRTNIIFRPDIMEQFKQDEKGV